MPGVRMIPGAAHNVKKKTLARSACPARPPFPASLFASFLASWLLGGCG